MHTRIKKLRRMLDLTQEKFAERIGIKRNTVATYESGRNEPVDSVVALVCREFNVNEDWLRYGKGEMFKPAPSGGLDQLAREYGLSHFDYILIEKFVNMKQESRDILSSFIMETAETFSESGANQEKKVMTEDPYRDVPDTPEELERQYPPIDKKDLWQATLNDEDGEVG